MTQAYDKLKRLLEELFQFDRKDLDFGIYRIMNHRRDEILKFLDHDLLPQVHDAFSEYRAGDEAQVREDLARLEKTLGDAGVTAESSPKYLALKVKLAETKDLSALENEVYSDLYTFFRRYYKNGDFLSLRRYKPGVYAVPYEGEEVKLHWANADQYYVKTAENFRNYRFELEGVGHVNFDLVAAATERDNNKAANEKERRFVLREEDPVEEADGELHVYFEYRPHPDKQGDLRDQARDAIFENVSGEWKTGLAEPRPTAGNKKRTLLEKHLAEYTARNTFDYFIHKDLGGFLRRELDFFLKSEVLHIDDLDTENERRVEQYLSKLKVIKRIGYKIIAFLAQIEDFQKKLFLKKKFVVSSGYCLTLDNVPEDLYEEIIANDAQYEEWERLFAISEIPPSLENGGDQRSVEWLKANPHLVLDTMFFGHDFKDRLLASIEDLDEKTDGLLVNSENFQALELLQERYREQVKCTYIDPPYNRGKDKDEFLYKDSYQHSSWLSMMNDRLALGREALTEDGVIFASIDDQELAILRELTERVFGENKIGTIVWKGATDNNPTRIAVEHEYVLSYAKDSSNLEPVWKNSNDDKKLLMLDTYEEIKKSSSNTEETQRAFRQFIRDNKESLVPLTHYDRVDEDGPYTGGRKVHNPGKEGYRYDVIHPVTGKPCKQPARGYRFPEARMKELLAADKIIFGDDEDQIIQIKEYLTEYAGSLKGVIELDSRVAANTLEALFASREQFRNPKPVQLLETITSFATGQADHVLDFFAGSGTTGHAVINLNREDGGRRKYVLVEMGEYFDSVLKKRIQKVIYSKDWKDGKPVSREGTSHIFKYMTLESYEDTLNNLSLKRTDVQDDLIESNPALREEYMLSYMLDFETKGSPSLLDLDSFEDPFSYRLNITRDDETRPESVDLVETFNYLLGLNVSRTYSSDGYRVIEGTNPAGERVLAIWRNSREKSNDDLDAFFGEGGYAGAGDPFDHVYANGDNTLALKAGDAKVHLIEEEFRRLMFETEGV